MIFTFLEKIAVNVCVCGVCMTRYVQIYLVNYKNTRPSRTSAVFVHASIQPKNGNNNISKALQISLLFRLFHWPFVFSAKHKNCKRFISRKKRLKKTNIKWVRQSAPVTATMMTLPILAYYVLYTNTFDGYLQFSLFRLWFNAKYCTHL